MRRLIECVPNFSEGRDMRIIRQITDRVESVDGVRLLNVDPGKATNRTVVTFVGEPEAVIEAAYRAIRTAGKLIDMSREMEPAEFVELLDTFEPKQLTRQPKRLAGKPKS